MLIKQKSPLLPRNLALDDSGMSLLVFSSRTNLKLHNISVTPTMVKKVIMNLDFSKASGPDCQGLIRKEKVDIDGEKSAQISTVAKKIVTQRWLQIMVTGPKQAGHYNYFVHFSLLYSYYVSDMIKKLELIFTGS